MPLDKILCVGTSITAGYPGYNIDEGTWLGQNMDNSSYGNLQSFYGTRLQERINAVSPNTHKVINRGWGGETSTERKNRLQSDITATSPKYVIIEAGANDPHNSISLATTQQNIIDMIAIVRSNNAIPIISTMTPYEKPYAQPNDAFFNAPNPSASYYTDTYIPQLVAWQRQYAQDNAIGLVDFYSAIVDPNQPVTVGKAGHMKPEYIGNDGYYVHMSVAGYQAMGDIINLSLFGITGSDPLTKPILILSSSLDHFKVGSSKVGYKQTIIEKYSITKPILGTLGTGEVKTFTFTLTNNGNVPITFVLGDTLGIDLYSTDNINFYAETKTIVAVDEVKTIYWKVTAPTNELNSRSKQIKVKPINIRERG